MMINTAQVMVGALQDKKIGTKEAQGKQERQEREYWDEQNEQGLREMWRNPEDDKYSPSYGRGATRQEERDQRGPRKTK